MVLNSTVSTQLLGFLVICALIACTFLVLPWILAALAWFRIRKIEHCQRHGGQPFDETSPPLFFFPLRLYTGRVWHSRFHPTRHSFTYPLFMFGVNLTPTCNTTDDVADTDPNELLWPLSLIMSFRPNQDHFKNSEGINQNDKCTNPLTAPPLSEFVLASLRERTTGGTNNRGNSKDWSRLEHEVVLLTHLCYYGYCFNPVSYYFIFGPSQLSYSSQERKLKAVVGEVSNTPWGEMHCFVLHESSIDSVQELKTGSSVSTKSKADITSTTGSLPSPISDSSAQSPTTSADTTPVVPKFSVRYVFPKAFHVSPFMEMNYLYDWTFHLSHDMDHLDIHNSLVSDTPQKRLHFHARMVVSSIDHFTVDDSRVQAAIGSRSAHLQQMERLLWGCAKHLSIFPFYCFIIQVWIHYEAFWLFLKGVPFQPHPKGAETFFSRIIGAVMTPFFILFQRKQSHLSSPPKGFIPSPMTKAKLQ